MNTNTITREFGSEVNHPDYPDNLQSIRAETSLAYGQLEDSIYAALETYSNVHRGSGHFSQVTTHLYERARQIVLGYLCLNPAKYTVIFCSQRRARLISDSLKKGSFTTLSSTEFGLNMGVTAVAVMKNILPDGKPFETGGGTTRLYGPDWVMWANIPDRFEAGTPSIINVIAFAKALLMMKRSGNDLFKNQPFELLNPEQILYRDELTNYSGNSLLAELRKTLIGSNIKVPTTRGMSPFINFDSSASTPTFKPIWEAFRNAYRQPENVRKAIVEEVRRICSESFGAPLEDYEIIFTSNTTESINLAAQSLPGELNDGIEPVILTTFLEHSSNDLPWRTVAGHTVIRLGVDNNGFFNLDELRTLLGSYNTDHKHGKQRIKLLAVSGASNVLGSCNDLQKIGQIAKEFRVRLFVDAAQLVAHRKVDMQASGIDYLALSAHKIYAPFGTGVLIARKGLMKYNDELAGLVNSSELENAGGIAALGKAMILLNRIGFGVIEKEERTLTTKALLVMSQTQGLKLHGISPDQFASHNKIGVIGFDVKNLMASKIANRLARRGAIGIRWGCLCAHLIIKQLSEFTPFTEKLQRFILKMIPILNPQGIARISFGIQNTEAEVDVLIGELTMIAGNADRKQSDGTNQEYGKSRHFFSDKIVKQQIKEFIKEREHLVYGFI